MYTKVKIIHLFLELTALSIRHVTLIGKTLFAISVWPSPDLHKLMQNRLILLIFLFFLLKWSVLFLSSCRREE